MANRSPHAQRIERWLGPVLAEGIARNSRGFYWPIPVLWVPGGIQVYNGDYIGQISGGGFASLSDLISERTSGGKGYVSRYSKTGVAAPAAGASQSLWGVGSVPAAGSNAAAAPGGTVFNNTSTGALDGITTVSPDTRHFVTWWGVSSVGNMALMLYDQLWGVNINHATTSNSITGVPTRYQTATEAPGNFLSGRVTTALGATAHNITVTYVNQAGTTQTGSAQAVRVSSAVQTLPFAAGTWFYTLNAGDTGLRSVTSITLSAASTGNVDWFIGHAIAIAPFVLANVVHIVDGINSAFNLERIYDGACLTFLEYFKSATTATTYNGEILHVYG